MKTTSEIQPARLKIAYRTITIQLQCDNNTCVIKTVINKPASVYVKNVQTFLSNSDKTKENKSPSYNFMPSRMQDLVLAYDMENMSHVLY